jgi:hypothetical protein
MGRGVQALACTGLESLHVQDSSRGKERRKERKKWRKRERKKERRRKIMKGEEKTKKVDGKIKSILSGSLWSNFGQ